MRAGFRAQTSSEAASYEEPPQRAGGTNPQLQHQLYWIQPSSGEALS